MSSENLLEDNEVALAQIAHAMATGIPIKNDVTFIEK